MNKEKGNENDNSSIFKDDKLSRQMVESDIFRITASGGIIPQRPVAIYSGTKDSSTSETSQPKEKNRSKEK